VIVDVFPDSERGELEVAEHHAFLHGEGQLSLQQGLADGLESLVDVEAESVLLWFAKAGDLDLEDLIELLKEAEVGSGGPAVVQT